MELSGAYEHLHPSVQAWADEDATARIRRIRTDRWIGYARAESTLTAIEDVLSFPKRTRMPNLLLVGQTNNGKTMIVEKFRRSHAPVGAPDTEDGVAHIPVLKIQMPAGPDERRFFAAILARPPCGPTKHRSGIDAHDWCSHADHRRVAQRPGGRT